MRKLKIEIKVLIIIHLVLILGLLTRFIFVQGFPFMLFEIVIATSYIAAFITSILLIRKNVDISIYGKLIWSLIILFLGVIGCGLYLLYVEYEKPTSKSVNS